MALEALATTATQKPTLTPGDQDAALQRLQQLVPEGEPLRLHLGCGEQRLNGYVNLDHPPANHNVMHVAADAFADVLQLRLPANSVDEIRLHHVFEHFSRVTALGLLIRWHAWLKPGGRLHIETPDLMGSARTLLSAASFRVKMGVTRHLAGDQAAPWGYHVDQWYAERFAVTLPRLGFEIKDIRNTQWRHEPHLANVEVVATKAADRFPAEQLAAAEALLEDSTVSPQEHTTLAVWREQLRTFVATGAPMQAPAARSIESLLRDQASAMPLAEIHNFNQRNRDRWVADKASSVANGSTVLDVGAGTCPYRPLFAHCRYISQDFGRYEGVKLGNTSHYGQIDLHSDITQLPAADETFDVVLCTEVLEHVPEPLAAVREMARVLRPGGKLLLTAPLGSGLHQLPFHFYGGYTPQWYQLCAQRYNLHVVEIVPNGGFFRMLAQECARVAGTLPLHRAHHGDAAALVAQLFGDWLPRYLFRLEDSCMISDFTVGYHVELRKPFSEAQSDGFEAVQLRVQTSLASGDAASALGFLQAFVDREPQHEAARLDLALLSHSLGHGDTALRTLEQGLALASGVAAWRRTLAMLYLQQQRASEAMRTLAPLFHNGNGEGKAEVTAEDAALMALIRQRGG